MKEDMGGLKKYMPKTYWTFVIGTLALVGIFPLWPASGRRTRSSPGAHQLGSGSGYALSGHGHHRRLA